MPGQGPDTTLLSLLTLKLKASTTMFLKIPPTPPVWCVLPETNPENKGDLIWSLDHVKYNDKVVTQTLLSQLFVLFCAQTQQPQADSKCRLFWQNCCKHVN